MALPPHASEWMNRAEMDYIGPFVKAWAAFNAWYRHASQETQERAMLNFVSARPNPVRRKILPLLRDDNKTAEAQSLKQAISDLQQSLDNIQFEIIRKGVVERISLRTVCINPKPLNNEQVIRNNFEYKASRIAAGAIEVTVTSQGTGVVRFSHIQNQYNPEELYTVPDFTANLSQTQQTRLRVFYDSCNPRPMHDLVQDGGPILAIGTMQFECSPEDLFAGLIETIYAMRNALLHGETDPDENVLACYEPAYRIVMHFLKSV